MSIKRILCALLAGCMMLPLASCGNAPAETETAEQDTAAVETEKETTEEEARLALPDDLPEADYKGSDFTILCYGHTSWLMDREELDGDVVNDAIYNRNHNVAERFNTNIVYDSAADYTAASTAAKNAVTSGDDYYQLAAYHFIQMGSDLLSNTFMNMNDVPYINFEKPWWNDTTVNDMTYKGVTFMGVGFIGLSNVSSAYCLFYNQGLAAEYSLPDVFSFVDEGTWTKDKMKELAEVVQQDVNGDGVKDTGDRYGMAFDLNGACDQFLWFFGKKIYTRQDDGTYADTYYDEKLVDLITWLHDFSFNGSYTYTEKSWGVGGTMFSAGNTLMVVGGIGGGLSYRDLDIDYSIIPAPKWDEKQEKYITVSDGSSEAIAVMTTVQDVEKVGVLTEALTAEGWKTMLPAYYETALKYKGTRDEKSVEILDMIVANVIFDFGYVFGGLSSATGAGFWIHKLLQQNSADITSHYEANKNNYRSTLDTAIAAFEAYLETNS